MASSVVLRSSGGIERAVLPPCLGSSDFSTGDSLAFCISLELRIAETSLQMLAETPHRAVASSLGSEFLWAKTPWRRYKLCMRGLHGLRALLSILSVTTDISRRESADVPNSSLLTVCPSFWALDIVEVVQTLACFWPP